MADQTKNILVVEDDATLRYLAKRQIRALGIICKLAANGAEAVDMFRGEDFDLIFMDVHMPIMSGIQATLEIRKLETERNKDTYVPIVAMTANPDREQCYNAGMNDFAFKPLSLDQMKKLIDRWVTRE